MLKRKALRKIFMTTLTAFVLLFVFSISNLYQEESIKTNLEIEYITGIGTNNIYLLDDNGYLVRTKIILDSNDKVMAIKQLINNLTIGANSKFPNGLKATIPRDAKLLDVYYDEGCVLLSFNKKIVDENLEKTIESIVFSIIDLGDINGVIIEVDGKMIPEYNRVLDKSIGINKTYNIKSRNNISSVVVYYLEEIGGSNYYVPVTKYINSSDEKINIIVEELTSSYIYEPNLMSFLNSNIKLLDYEKEDNIMTINFNNAIFDKDNKILEEVTYTLAYSVFSNYNIDQLIIKVEGKQKESINLDDIKF